MRAEVIGHIGGPVRSSVNQRTRTTGYNHPIFQPGTKDSRADVFDAYASEPHPLWAASNGDGEQTYRFTLDITMAEYEGRKFQSVRLLGVEKVTEQRAPAPAPSARS